MQVLIPTKKVFEFTFAEYIKFLRDNFNYITSINKNDNFFVPDPVNRIFNNFIFKKAERFDKDMIEAICEKLADDELKSKIRGLVEAFRDHTK